MTRGRRRVPARTRRPADAATGARGRSGPLPALGAAAVLLAAAVVPCAPLAADGPDAAGRPAGATISPRESPARPGQPAARQEGTPRADAAAADTSDLDARTARLADQLRCPVCRSQSVLESSSRLAREMKAEIRRRLAEGQSQEQVKAYFVSRYGEWILLRPEAEGLNLMVYILPPLLLVGGGLLVWALLRRWSPRRVASEGEDTGRSPATGAAAPADDGLSPEEERRLEEALRADAEA